MVFKKDNSIFSLEISNLLEGNLAKFKLVTPSAALT